MITFIYKGCHSAGDPGDVESFHTGNEQIKLRKKRQVAITYVPVEDFFVGCMKPYLWGSDLDVATVVKFTVRETLWFQNSDEIFCKR